MILGAQIWYEATQVFEAHFEDRPEIPLIVKLARTGKEKQVRHEASIYEQYAGRLEHPKYYGFFYNLFERVQWTAIVLEHCGKRLDLGEFRELEEGVK